MWSNDVEVRAIVDSIDEIGDVIQIACLSECDPLMRIVVEFPQSVLPKICVGDEMVVVMSEGWSGLNGMPLSPALVLNAVVVASDSYRLLASAGGFLILINVANILDRGLDLTANSYISMVKIK